MFNANVEGRLERETGIILYLNIYIKKKCICQNVNSRVYEAVGGDLLPLLDDHLEQFVSLPDQGGNQICGAENFPEDEDNVVSSLNKYNSINYLNYILNFTP